MKIGVPGGLVVVALSVCACGSSDDEKDGAAPPCAIAGANVLAPAYLPYAYPDDRFGLTVKGSAESISASGSVEATSSFGALLQECLDASAFAGVSFRVSGNAGTAEDLYLFLTTRDNASRAPGTCKPRDSSTEFSDCHGSSLTFPSANGSYHFRWNDFSGGSPNAIGDRKGIISWGIGFPEPEQPFTTQITIDQFEYF